MIGCSTRPEHKTIDKTVDSISTKEQGTVDKKAIIYKNVTLHNFSSPVDLDTFKIYVTGKTIKDGEFTFKIVTSKGETILEEKYQSLYLVDFGFDERLGTEEEYIKKRLDSFFSEEHFKKPAITDQTFDGNYSDKAIWEDIRSDKTSIGFKYLIGKEDGRHIAYSKSKRKVVMYFNCC